MHTPYKQRKEFGIHIQMVARDIDTIIYMHFAATYIPIAREDNFIGHLECGLFSLGTLPITLHLLHQHILSISSEHYFYNLAIDVISYFLKMP